MPRTPNQPTMPRIGHEVRVSNRPTKTLAGRTTKNRNRVSPTTRQLQESRNSVPPINRMSTRSESRSRCSLNTGEPSLTVGAGEFEFGLAQRDGGKKHRQKSPRAHQQTQAIRHTDQAESEEIVHQHVLVWLAAQPPSKMAQCSAGDGLYGDSRQRGPQHVDQRLVQAGVAKLVQSEQSHPQHHKWKCAAVIHASFAGQGEAELIAVAGMTDLDIGRKYRVGRRQDRA